MFFKEELTIFHQHPYSVVSYIVTNSQSQNLCIIIQLQNNLKPSVQIFISKFQYRIRKILKKKQKRYTPQLQNQQCHRQHSTKKVNFTQKCKLPLPTIRRVILCLKKHNIYLSNRHENSIIPQKKEKKVKYTRIKGFTIIITVSLRWKEYKFVNILLINNQLVTYQTPKTFKYKTQEVGYQISYIIEIHIQLLQWKILILQNYYLYFQ
eukprot:TRINITY_DN35856_c0_g1_i1.p2 TRINITY_DN35856_c0_g1~~TRINITY_DN35856_c0_g1_i1.p2  ORF type:complete len:208 (-),score=-28.06 TRINITY_DN35856_c0_g1_i1:473-1096(-)